MNFDPRKQTERMFRNFIGFDQLFEPQGYPPHNITESEDGKYSVDVAVAGFQSDELEVISARGNLSISGKKSPETSEGKILHRGIAARDFKLNFKLGEHIVISGATHKDGILSIKLEKIIPEDEKPQKIEINAKPIPPPKKILMEKK